MDVIKTAVSGALGRMGRQVMLSLLSDIRFKIVFGVDSGAFENSSSGLWGIDVYKDFPQDISLDLIIDFSSCEGFTKALNHAVSHKISFLSGTTGLTDSHLSLLKEASYVISVLHSPNMSAGYKHFI